MHCDRGFRRFREPEAYGLIKSMQPDLPPEKVYIPGQPAAPTPRPYDFIINPEKPATKQTLLPGANSLLMRVVLVTGGLVVLIIAFSVVKGLISGGSNLPSLLAVAQDQQELVHLATNATQQPDLSTTNQDFAATAQLSLTSAQLQLLNYIHVSGHKVDPKVLNLKLSATTDNLLTAAAAATTYNQTFHDVMKTKLTDYTNDLNQGYRQTKGKNGRTLLSNDYNQAQLLLTELDSPAS